MDKATQQRKIFNYCQEHGSITIREAFEKLYINSPSKRISEMRLGIGYDVQSIDEVSVKDDGTKVKFKRYFIKELNNRGQCRAESAV